jgi:hypothetical protein
MRRNERPSQIDLRWRAIDLVVRLCPVEFLLSLNFLNSTWKLRPPIKVHG